MDSPSVAEFGMQLVRAFRQGIFFGVETRVPYAIVSILRPYLFNKPARPLLKSLKFYSQQTIQHGYIIAKISVLFKFLERVLQVASSAAKVEEWHTFVAGAIAGYSIMCAQRSDESLKRQVNMAIGIRTLYALGTYMIRTERIPLVPNSPKGFQLGGDIWVTLLWGVVMWHWRHQTKSAPGEMVISQVRQMDEIYSAGDAPGPLLWMVGRRTSAMWLAAVIAGSTAI
jgi:hypothetical protein